MTVEQNKQLARKIIEDLSNGFVDESDLTDDFRPWSAFSGEIPRDVWLASLAGKHHIQSGPSNFHITAMTAEGDRVAIEYTSATSLVNGKTYRNNYHTLMIFRDGKLARSKEFMDTRYLVETLGPLIPRIASHAQVLKEQELSPSAQD